MKKKRWQSEFGDNLAIMMREENMTQEDLAKASGLSQSVISHYVQGLRAPSVKAIINIAYALNCSIDDLIDFGETLE